MISKMPKKRREFLETECVRIANGQTGGRGTERVTIKRLFPRGGGPNWDVDEIHPQFNPGYIIFQSSAIRKSIHVWNKLDIGICIKS